MSINLLPYAITSISFSLPYFKLKFTSDKAIKNYFLF